MWDCPDFLDLPARTQKPRDHGLTHVLDKGLPVEVLEQLLVQTGHLVDVLKVGWGIAYVDPTAKQRVARCDAAGVTVSLGGTLLEICAAQGKVEQLRRWAADLGVHAIEVSNGLEQLSRSAKGDLIRSLAGDFVVLAETGAKDSHSPVVTDTWLAEMEADLDAGARWVIAEGRESGTVGVYDEHGRVREALVEAIVDRVPVERVIFEAPQKHQQVWFIEHLGPDVNLGNVPTAEVIALETLRLGLRADTALTLPRAHPAMAAGQPR
jgi:phosphosulfolactate synthase